MKKSANRAIDNSEYEVLARALEREKLARQRSEDLLESMSADIFEANELLLQQNKAMLERSAELEFLSKVTAMAEEDIEFIAAIGRFLNLSQELLGWPLAHAYLSVRGKEIGFKSSRIWAGPDACTQDDFKAASETMTFGLGEGLPGRVAAQNQVVWIKDLSSDEKFPRAKIAKNFSYRSGFGVPLAMDGKVFAVFEFFHHHSIDENLSKARIVHMGATQLARILERLKNQKELLKNYRELKSTQQQLLQSEKMASLGIISAGVAHEINNPLSFVLSNLEVLKKYCRIYEAADSAVKDVISAIPKNQAREFSDKMRELDFEYIRNDSFKLVEETLSGVMRVRDIVFSLKSFSRLDTDEPAEFDLLECVNQAVRLLGNEIKFSCDIELDLKPLPKIKGISGQITQVFMNLIMNSMQAMENKRGKIWIRSEVLPTGRIRLVFTDSGSGMSADVLKNIFTPFYTTKPVGKGTGLGLSISYGIVKAHGGDISVKSAPGLGSTFEIIFDGKEQETTTKKQEEEFEW